MMKRRKAKVGGRPFKHASGLTDPVAVIAEHSLAANAVTEHVEVPRGYRARTVDSTDPEPSEQVHPHADRRSA